jgi:hypothetical protein
MSQLNMSRLMKLHYSPSQFDIQSVANNGQLNDIWICNLVRHRSIFRRPRHISPLKSHHQAGYRTEQSPAQGIATYRCGITSHAAIAVASIGGPKALSATKAAMPRQSNTREIACVSIDAAPISERRQLSASVTQCVRTPPPFNRPRWKLVIGGKLVFCQKRFANAVTAT